MSNFRKRSWTDLAEPDEHLTVFVKLDEALGRFLGDFAPSSGIAYTVHAEDGSSVDLSARAQVSDAIDSLEGSAKWLSVSYTRSSLSQGPGRSVTFFTEPLAAFTEPLGIKHRISCCLMVFGNDESEINELFESLCARLDEEIKRVWPKSNSARQQAEPPVADRPVSTPSKGKPGRATKG
jgi:hypothetical protein